MNKTTKILIVVISLLFLSTSAYADVGLPMIFVTFPSMIIALIPVILIEGYVLNRKMKWDLKKSMKASAVSNIISTVVGIPLAWIGLVGIELGITGGRGIGTGSQLLQSFLSVTLYSPWLFPDEKNLYWILPTASLFLCIPFFFVSWFIESITARMVLKGVDVKEIKEGFYWSNLFSYLLLVSLCFVWLVSSLFLHLKDRNNGTQVLVLSSIQKVLYQRELDQTIARFSKAIELNPNDYEAYYHRGADYDGKENYDQAISDYSKALNIKPDFAIVYDLRAHDYY